MREVSVTYKLYRFEELSESAKEKALADYVRTCDYPWSGELRDTLKAFCEMVGIDVDRWSYDAWSHDSGSINWHDWSDECFALSGDRARSYFWNNYGRCIFKAKTIWPRGGISVNTKSRKSRLSVSCDCPFTGVCFDMDILDPMVKFMTCQDRRMDVTVEQIIRDCVESLFESAETDCRHCESMEYFADMCLGNDWEFREDGTIE